MTIRIDELVDDRRIVICCGTGGVGKTTIAAVLALESARRGRNACVVTIDPARRLADALGIEHLTNDPTEIDRALWTGIADDDVVAGGRLSALMLDTKSTFDLLVAQRVVTRSRRSGSSTTASIATSPVRSAARRSTWRWRSCTSCTTRATST